MIKAIFFDFDGTICDTRRIVFDESVKILEDSEYFLDKTKIRKYLGIRFEEFLKKFGVSDEKVDELREKFYKRIVEKAKREKLISCVDLKPLKKIHKKYILAVISNAESNFTKTCAKKLKIEKLFREIHGAEGFKTKDEIMRLLFKKYNLRKKEVLYVGDRFSDIEFAKKAGCWSVAIHNNCSWSSMDRIIEKNPDYIIADFYDLEELIAKIKK